jgi:hypothetical protein
VDLDAGCFPSNPSQGRKNHEIGRKHYCLEINDEHKEEFFEFRGQIEFD